MDIDLDKLKSITEEALMVSMIKMLVYKDLNKKLNKDLNETVINKINNRPNNFYEPSEQDLRTADNFEAFINILSDKVIKEVR